MSIGLSAIEYALPDTRPNLSELEREGLLDTPAERLRDFGFEFALVGHEPSSDLGIAAAASLLNHSAVDPESVDAVICAGAIPSSHAVANHEPLGGFAYPASRIQYECGMVNARAIGISQMGCMGMMTAVKCAADLLVANPAASRVLCVSADVLPPGSKREIMYNVISDGACAVLVERESPRNRIVAHRHLTKGYYWDCTSRLNEIVAAYFPTSRHIVLETLAEHDLTPNDLAWLIPHNVSRRSWEILSKLLGLPMEKVFTENIAARGHVIAADNFINLKDAEDAGRLKPSDKLLLFNFGFGANWGCLLLEH